MNDSSTLFAKSRNDVKGYQLPECELEDQNIDLSGIPKHLIRQNDVRLPELSEPEVVRHFVNLSVKNHHVDRDFYPLGSCTMKYNPKINEKIAGLEAIQNLHPLQELNDSQGILSIFHELSEFLKKMTGFPGMTLQPSAGSQGEFVGLLIMQQYHHKKKNEKKTIIIPETAHGTNPASVILAGYTCKQVKSNDRGRVDIDHLRSIVDEKVAGMMLTQPNTLGLFEDEIEEISSIIHNVDGIMYMDGANLNALIGITRPVDMGFDIVHINLHKTFSTPHGGGGPGAGPIGVVEKLIPFLPTPVLYKTDSGFIWKNNCPDSIGRIHSFYGNAGILVRAWAYIRTLGEDGVKQMTRNAIINANYLKKKISAHFHIPFSDGTLHEFVASGLSQKKRGAKMLDIAKSLLDYGFHAPTIYFPLNIPEAMMVEPTESETKETLDAFADALIKIDKQIDEDPQHLKEAPVTTPVRRLNETKANRELNLKYNFEL